MLPLACLDLMDLAPLLLGMMLAPAVLVIVLYFTVSLMMKIFGWKAEPQTIHESVR